MSRILSLGIVALAANGCSKANPFLFINEASTAIEITKIESDGDRQYLCLVPAHRAVLYEFIYLSQKTDLEITSESKETWNLSVSDEEAVAHIEEGTVILPLDFVAKRVDKLVRTHGQPRTTRGKIRDLGKSSD